MALKLSFAPLSKLVFLKDAVATSQVWTPLVYSRLQSILRLAGVYAKPFLMSTDYYHFIKEYDWDIKLLHDKNENSQINKKWFLFNLLNFNLLLYNFNGQVFGVKSKRCVLLKTGFND
jgi:hypothetical protein